LLVTGSNFIQASVGRVNGSSRSTSFVNNTTLRMTLSTADISVAGTLAITVFNPALGGGVSNIFDFFFDNPVATVNPMPPSVSSIKPNLVGAGSPVLNLIVNGSNFKVGSFVRFNNSARATTFVRSSQLTAVIFASDLAVPGNFPVDVFTVGADGGRSSPLTLTVQKRNPVPNITSITPNAVNSGGSDFQLTVNGANFINGSRISINGISRQTTFMSSAELKTTIFRNDILNRGQLNISVTTPQPGGGATPQIPLIIGDPANLQPALSTISPNLVGEGGSAFKLKVTGMRFIPGSIVRLDNVARATTFVSSTQLTASIPASDLIRAKIFSVQVFNQEPGGGVSTTAMLEVRKRNPLPRITSLSTDFVNAGEAGFTLTLNGVNFARNAAVRVKGVMSTTASTRTPTFINSSQLSISIFAQDVFRVGEVTVFVVNPSPGGGNSNVMIIKVQ
jgi:hypothetical protein